MSDESTRTQTDQPEPQRIPPSLWHKYAGKRVALQFKDHVPYLGVTYPGNFVLHPETKAPLGSPVHERLVLETADPNPANAGVKITIVIDPSVVDYATFCEKPLIER